MNYHIYRQLIKFYTVNCIEGINPAYNSVEKIISKVKRTIGGKGVFSAFSNKRLTKISHLVTPQINNDAVLNFFHGSTPWLDIRQTKPYSFYTDCCFATYLTVYHNPADFSAKQVKQLYKKEEAFYKNARAVFFSSQWALNETKKKYNLNGDNFYRAGLGSGLEGSIKQKKNAHPFFLFIALDFYGKGGMQIVKAFNSIKNIFPEFSLIIVGERPPAEILNSPGIRYEGYLNKSVSNELNKIKELYADAYCLLLPSSKDMTPLVLIEAAAAGCPAIATNAFGIPEMVVHGETGILIPADFNDEHLREALITICCDINYRNMLGKNAADYSQKKFAWNKTGEIIYNTLTTQLRS